jgi:Holliday junction DNA helicase RuvA
MIRMIEGEVISQKNGVTIIKTANGIGWGVRTGSILFEVGTKICLYIYTQFKENEISLWGFKDLSDLEVFEFLLSVNGVGARIAHNLIIDLGKDTIIKAIQLNEPNLLKIPGVGLKTAQKIIFSLNDKLNDFKFLSGDTTAEEGDDLQHNTNIQEALDALQRLGYNKTEIVAVLRDLAREQNDLSTEALVKLALKYLN